MAGNGREEGAASSRVRASYVGGKMREFPSPGFGFLNEVWEVRLSAETKGEQDIGGLRREKS